MVRSPQTSPTRCLGKEKPDAGPTGDWASRAGLGRDVPPARPAAFARDRRAPERAPRWVASRPGAWRPVRGPQAFRALACAPKTLEPWTATLQERPLRRRRRRRTKLRAAHPLSHSEASAPVLLFVLLRPLLCEPRPRVACPSRPRGPSPRRAGTSSPLRTRSGALRGARTFPASPKGPGDSRAAARGEERWSPPSLPPLPFQGASSVLPVSSPRIRDGKGSRRS